MAKNSSRSRVATEINASSMADIAFLLLIFFLVTTTIDVDKGILVKLPPWSNEPPPEMKLNSRNVFSVLVNANNDLLVRKKPADLAKLRERAVEFITYPSGAPDLAERPTKAIISLKNDRGTGYDTYLTVYNELKAAYNEIWDEEAKALGHPGYSDDLPLAVRKQIKLKIPMVLSEAEPTAFGEEK